LHEPCPPTSDLRALARKTMCTTAQHRPRSCSRNRFVYNGGARANGARSEEMQRRMALSQALTTILDQRLQTPYKKKKAKHVLHMCNEVCLLAHISPQETHCTPGTAPLRNVTRTRTMHYVRGNSEQKKSKQRQEIARLSRAPSTARAPFIQGSLPAGFANL
jgi:hypothetical protein